MQKYNPQAGLTGLFTASFNGHLDVVRLLLDSKADANLANQVPAMPNIQICSWFLISLLSLVHALSHARSSLYVKKELQCRLMLKA